MENMNIKNVVDPDDYEVGVIIARFQVDELHIGHKQLIDKVCSHHKKVIIFLGVPVIGGTEENPLDYASRKTMIQESYPNVVILPNKDQRSDELWSKRLDDDINIPFGERTTLLYGSRNSFLPHYHGKNKITELTAGESASGTEVRKEISRETPSDAQARRGVIYSVYSKRAVTYPTVDIVAYNDEGLIILAKKPNEDKYRFIGGFVDREDYSWEQAARREFREETSGSEIDDLRYVASGQIKDWRYEGIQDGIMTTLFLGKFIYGPAKASDDIASLHWVDVKEIEPNQIMEEHRELYIKLKPIVLDIQETIEKKKHEFQPE